MNGIILQLRLGMPSQLTFFKKSIINAKQENSLFSVYDPLGVKLPTCLRLQFSHLNKHKFRHSFSDTINPMCLCGTKIKTMEHFFLCSHFYSTQRLELFENLKKVY